MGDNRPPVGELLADQIERLPEHLQAMSADIRARMAELTIQAAEFPRKIDDDDMCVAGQDLIKDLRACRKTAKALHDAAKEPVLEAGRLIGGHFKAGIIDPLDATKTAINDIVTEYQVRKAAAEQAVRDEAARKAREAAQEAQRVAEEAAAKVKSDDELQAAIEAEAEATTAKNKAAKADKNAAASPAELSRTRSTKSGTVGSLRSTWTYEGVDRDTLDLELLRQHLPEKALHQAVGSFVKAGGRDLRGVTRIFEHHETVSR